MSRSAPAGPPPRSKIFVRRFWLFAGLLVWAFATLIGFRALASYESKAGPATRPAAVWPVGTGLTLDRKKINLVMFAHPQCPCTRASMAELEMLLTRCPEAIKASVCFYSPADEPVDWTDTSLLRRARAIPGVTVTTDRDGRIAAQFGALTSGHVFVFDGQGRRLFSGGITGARGHEGDNRGLELVTAFARGERHEPAQTPVFGCSLADAPGDLKETWP